MEAVSETHEKHEKKEKKEKKEEKEEKEENILEKTKHKFLNVEHKAEEKLKPLADKLHMKPW